MGDEFLELQRECVIRSHKEFCASAETDSTIPPSNIDFLLWTRRTL